MTNFICQIEICLGRLSLFLLYISLTVKIISNHFLTIESGVAFYFFLQNQIVPVSIQHSVLSVFPVSDDASLSSFLTPCGFYWNSKIKQQVSKCNISLRSLPLNNWVNSKYNFRTIIIRFSQFSPSIHVIFH